MRLLVKEIRETEKQGPTKRHEVFSKERPCSVLVFFEGMEDEPFLRRENDEIRFVYTDLTVDKALSSAEKSGEDFKHSIFETDFEEFYKYFNEARQNRLVPIR